ncbi:MAG: M20/M25/M40 family metallo-hydrolase [bacterium]|nr:M20/M25/M40 family metallo-hydrolase [bacterium]
MEKFYPIMMNKIISLTKKFISIRSDPENAEELDRILKIALSNLEGYRVEQFESNGYKSALIYNTPMRPSKFKIILNGHLDVISGKEYQYVPQIRNNRLYGVGSMDMKANVACLIMVFREIANQVNYPLGLQLVTDEETGGFNGTKHQIDRGVRADFIIAGETTNFQIVNKAKGVLLVKISVKGETAHGAYPWKGENAIWKMNKLLSLLEKKYPIPKQEKWVTTINLSRIETSNRSFNKIPDDCATWLDIRYIPEEADTIVGEIKALLPTGFKLDIVTNEQALLVDRNNQYLKVLKKVGKQITKKKVSVYGAQGTSDARHYSRVNCNGIEFGPIGGGIGTDNEWVDIPSLETYCQILKSFLLSLENVKREMR